jgi:hypothetical protein
MKTLSLAAAALAAGVFANAAANATTIDFSYNASGVPVATGSFTYPTGLTGVLGYGDLTAFSVTLAGETYTLADALSLTQYVYFAYDTAAHDFVTNTDACGSAGCGYGESLGAINDTYSFGYFFNGVPGGYLEYQTYNGNSFDSLTFSSGTPEPATWMMMLLGAGLVGGAVRRRSKASMLAA